MKNLSAIFTVAAQLAIPLYAGAATPDPQQDEDYATELQRKVDQGDGDAALQIGNLLVRSRIPGPRYGTPITWFKKGCTLRSLPACPPARLPQRRRVIPANRGTTVSSLAKCNAHQGTDRATSGYGCGTGTGISNGRSKT